ncbi:MAG: nicotinate-nucleotide adenylyltransferase [Dehalococcoidia bacterium]|nr:nicotinate-nucleotide adenylyltransferase [Dehalococcoidia bacterium]
MAEPLVLLGGTFDPPHLGHLVLAECARVQLGARFAIFLPAGDPWRKTGSAPGPPRLSEHDVTPGMHRLEMTRLATRDNLAFRVDDREVRRAGPTYTADTLEELHREGHANLVLVIGTDALKDLVNWKSPERIRELARIAIAVKPGDDEADIPAAGAMERIDMPRLAISSTEIRERVAAGKPIRYLVPAAVEAYIAEHHLFRAEGS